MKLTIKQLDGDPIGALRQRRVLGEFTLAQRGGDPGHSYELQRTLVAVDEQCSLVVEASYTPANGVLSVIAAHQKGGEEVHVFSSVTEFSSVPTVFCFRLPAGQYIEFYVGGG